MPESHERRPECISEITRLDARVAQMEETLRRQNGTLTSVAEKLTEVRVSLAEIDAEVRAFQAHSEQFEADLLAYRRSREEAERESARRFQRVSQDLAHGGGDSIQKALGLPLWKFLLLLVGLVVILGMGIEGGRWLMSRGGGIPAQGVTRPAPARGVP